MIMFEETRQQYGLTRNDLALLTGRSVGYLLKAEQATFPNPPISLLNFYTRDKQQLEEKQAQLDTVLGAALSGFLVRNWQKLDKDVLVSEYRDKQRKTREAWLDKFIPVLTSTADRPFRFKWYSSIDEDGDMTAPNAYQTSCGLCIPAAVLWRNETTSRGSSAITTAMVDLVEFVESGRFRARYYGEDSNLDVEEAVVRIAKEEGYE